MLARDQVLSLTAQFWRAYVSKHSWHIRAMPHFHDWAVSPIAGTVYERCASSILTSVPLQPKGFLGFYVWSLNRQSSIKLVGCRLQAKAEWDKPGKQPPGHIITAARDSAVRNASLHVFTEDKPPADIGMPKERP